jgi:vacuolar-type H+-ATPase subunit I/STV1
LSPRYKKIADKWAQRYKSKGISESDLRNEIAFKITKELIDDPSQFNAIVTKELTMGQRLLIWFKNLANRLSKNNLTAEAKAVREAVKALEAAVREARNVATEKTANEETVVRFSMDGDTETKSIKKQLRENQDTLNEMEIVATVNSTSIKDLSRAEKIKRIMKHFDSHFKKGIERPNFGFVTITEK